MDTLDILSFMTKLCICAINKHFNNLVLATLACQRKKLDNNMMPARQTRNVSFGTCHRNCNIIN